MNFGKLRVLNDDIIEGGKGFGLHPHNNMEIISIPLKGALQHRHNRGSGDIIAENKVLVISAGKGISHSEHNAFPDKDTNFLQIWIYPRTMNTEPRNDSKEFDPALRKNQFQLLVSPDGVENSMIIHQKAYISRALLQAKKAIGYKLFNDQNGVYIFVIAGKFNINDEVLELRDGAGITDQKIINLSTVQGADVLAIEVPMT